MNWKEIEKKYPTAHRKVKNTYPMYIYPGIHQLFNFFDENDLFIEVSPYKVNDWVCSIYVPYEDESMHCVFSEDGFMNRSRATEVVFLKVFELLDKKL